MSIFNKLRRILDKAETMLEEVEDKKVELVISADEKIEKYKRKIKAARTAFNKEDINESTEEN